MRFPENEIPTERPDRPLGVTLLTAWDALIFGIVPVMATIFGAVRGGMGGASEFSVYLVVFISIMIVSAAIGTFMGSDRARMALIYLVVIYQCLQVFNFVLVLFVPSSSAPEKLQAVARMLAAIFWIVLHVWYFFRPATLDFYRRPRKSGPPPGLTRW